MKFPMLSTLPSHTNSSWARRLLCGVLPAGIAAAALSGCVFDSPYWAQTFNTTTTPIPIQTWTVSKNYNIKIECSKAYHAGLQPLFGPEEWHVVTNLVPSTKPSYDPAGAAAYSAGVTMALPAACWYADNAYSPPKYMTALRATHLDSSGSTTVYRVFDPTGLECLGREIGKAASWFGWLTKGCAKTYSDGSTPMPWVRVIANAPGAAALRASSSSLTSHAAVAAAPSTEAMAEALNKAFQAEAADTAWGGPMQARLRNSYDSVSPAGSVLVDATCRRHLCRVEVTHADEAAQHRFAAALAPQGLFTNDGVGGAVLHKAEGKNGVRSVYFIAREGKDLSTLAAGR